MFTEFPWDSGKAGIFSKIPNYSLLSTKLFFPRAFITWYFVSRIQNILNEILPEINLKENKKNPMRISILWGVLSQRIQHQFQSSANHSALASTSCSKKLKIEHKWTMKLFLNFLGFCNNSQPPKPEALTHDLIPTLKKLMCPMHALQVSFSTSYSLIPVSLDKQLVETGSYLQYP